MSLFSRVADDFGVPVVENRELDDELEKRGLSVGEDVIPSIRSIEQINRGHPLVRHQIQTATIHA